MVSDAFHALQNIGSMSKHVFQLLTRLIRHVRKQPEGCHIDKMLLPEQADIARKIPAADSDLRCLFHVFRQLQRCRKIIRTACRDIAERHIFAAPHQSRHRLIECPVPTAADHEIIITRPLCGDLYRIACCLRRMHGHAIASLYHHL